MSGRALVWAAQQRGLDPITKLVLMGFADAAREAEAWPSYAHLAEFAGVERKAIMRAIAKLRERGLIVPTGRCVGISGRIKAYNLPIKISTREGPLKTVDSPSGGPICADDGPSEGPIGGGNSPSQAGQWSLSGTTEPVYEPEYVEDDICSQAFVGWNETAKRMNWPIARDLTDARRKAINACISQHGPAGWKEAIRKAESSAFLSDPNQNWWGLDWLSKRANFTKVLEGKYDGRPLSGSGSSRRSSHEIANPMVAAALEYENGAHDR